MQVLFGLRDFSILTVSDRPSQPLSKTDSIVAWKTLIFGSLERLDDQMLDMSLSAFQARLFLTSMSFSVELTHEPRYLKSGMTFKILLCRESRGAG